MIESQPFARFWKSLNDHLVSVGLPEIGFTAARSIWEDAVSKAGSEARAIAKAEDR